MDLWATREAARQAFARCCTAKLEPSDADATARPIVPFPAARQLPNRFRAGAAGKAAMVSGGEGTGRGPDREERPTLRSAGGLLFARFRCWEHPESLRGTIEHALFLPSARRNFWSTPNSLGLRRVRAVWLNAIRDVALQAIRSDSGVLGYRGRSKQGGGRDNS